MATDMSEEQWRRIREFSSQCDTYLNSEQGQTCIQKVLRDCMYITWCRKCGNDYAECQGRRCGPRRNWNLDRARDARERFEKRTGRKWIIY